MLLSSSCFNAPVVVVTGGTGRVGRLTVAALRDAGLPVGVLVRPTAALPEGWDGVDVRLGDLDDPASVARAFAGADTVVLLSAMAPWLDRWEVPAVAAAAEAGVGHIVKISTTVPDPRSPISWWRAHWRAEAAVRAAGVPWTILRPNGIMMFFLDFAPEVREHARFSTAAGGGRMALVHPGDVAEVAARVAAEGARWHGQTLVLTGPEAVSYDDIAARLGSLRGRPVVHRRLDAEAGRRWLVEQGVGDWVAEGTLANWLMTRDEVGDFPAVHGDVERVLGRAPRSVDDYLGENLAAFGSAA